MSSKPDYRYLRDLIKNNNFRIETKECFDPQSGWCGTHYFVFDDATLICDLSLNGYCFRENTIPDSIKKIEDYINDKNFNTFEAFKEWVEKVAK